MPFLNRTFAKSGREKRLAVQPMLVNVLANISIYACVLIFWSKSTIWLIVWISYSTLFALHLHLQFSPSLSTIIVRFTETKNTAKINLNTCAITMQKCSQIAEMFSNFKISFKIISCTFSFRLPFSFPAHPRSRSMLGCPSKWNAFYERHKNGQHLC